MKNKEIKLGAILSYITIALNSIISILYTPILTRQLGQSEYGLYSLISSTISYLTVLDLGFGNAIIVYTARYRAKKETDKEQKLYGMFLIIYTIIGILVSLIGVALFLNIDVLFGKTMSVRELETAKLLMKILTLNLAITFPLSVFSSIITAYEKFIFAKLVNIIRIILTPCIMIPLLNMGYKSVALVTVITILNVSSLLINMMYCVKKIKIKVKFGKIDFKLLIEIFVYSFWIFLNTIIDKINWSLDNFLIGSLKGTIDVSKYSVASQINQLYISVSTAISGLLLPKITKMIENGATDKEMTDIFIKTGRIQFLIVGLILSGFVVFGKSFIILWVGEKYIDSYMIAIVLMVPMLISLIQNSGTSIMQAKNKHKFLPKVLIVTSVLNVIMSIPLINILGGLGAAIGTAVSLIIGNIIIKNIYYYKVLKLNTIEFFKKTSKIFITVILEILLTFQVLKNFNIDSWKELFMGIILYTIFYTIIMITFLMNRYEKDLICGMITEVWRKRKNE